jgi:hypothetical protein
MWSLFKGLVFVVLCAAALYGIFFVPLGGATLADHARVIWTSTVVQDRVRRVRDGVSEKLESKLERALANRMPASAAPQGPEISDADRHKLENLLRTSK